MASLKMIERHRRDRQTDMDGLVNSYSLMAKREVYPTMKICQSSKELMIMKVARNTPCSLVKI
jgi:hypothetical protein